MTKLAITPILYYVKSKIRLKMAYIYCYKVVKVMDKELEEKLNMKNKYNRKYQVSYKTNVDGDSHRGYFETIYLYPEETEIDLINKIEERIRPSKNNTYYEYTEIKI